MTNHRLLKCLYLIISVLIAQQVFSQNISAKEWETIRSNDQYIIGVGMSSSVDVSRHMAIQDLVSKISSQVESQFDYIMKQQSKGNHIETESSMQNIIRSYSAVTLNNQSEYIAYDKKKQPVVYRFIKRSELRAMFKKRVNSAKMWMEEARQSEMTHRIGDALQYYYWSLALLRSCPDGDLESIENDGEKTNMMQNAYTAVKDILSQIEISAKSVEKEGVFRRVTLEIKYKGQPVSNFNYKYHDGKNYSHPYTAKDGTGELLLPPNAKINKLSVFAEYECREEANINMELRSVMENTAAVPFQSARIDVNTKGCSDEKIDYAMLIANENAQNKYIGQCNDDRNETEAALTSYNMYDGYMNVVGDVVKAIQEFSLDRVRTNFTNDGWDMFLKLVRYGEAKMLSTSSISFYETNKHVVCRGIKMSFSFKSNKRTFVEDIVFYMDKDKRISEVAFGLENSAIKDVMRRGAWDDEARFTIIHFLETYKTAYALKRIDYLENVFSDNALIIVGKMVSPTGQKEMEPAKLKHVKYTRQTKSEYMNSLKKCFDSNEYVNLHFADNIVRKSTDKDIYGIQIKQDYFSSSYGDCGYLFLLIGFDNPESPVIHVRTWQPDDDPNVQDGRIGMADFNF